MTFRLNRIMLTLVLVASAAGVCRSEEPSTPGSLKQSDVKRLLKSAQTREEYAQLAAYFEDRSKDFEQKAREEDQELNRLNQATFRAKNFPILVDRARNSGDYDRAQSKKCAEEALTYRQKAAGRAANQSSVAE